MKTSENNVAKVHNLLNKLYQKADVFLHELQDMGFDVELLFVTNNYINIDGDFSLQHYPIPVIQLEANICLGINLDNIYLEILFSKDDLGNIELKKILNKYDNIDIYGEKNSLDDLLDEGDSIQNIIKKIKDSSEENIVFSFYFDLDQRKILDKVFSILAMLNLD